MKISDLGSAPPSGKESESPKLYNVGEDIGETNKVIEANSEISEKLRKRMEEFDAGVKAW